MRDGYRQPGPADGLPPVILLGGGIIALSAARSLSHDGITVLALDEPNSVVRYTRHAKFVDLPDQNPDSWTDWLFTTAARKHPGAVLLSCSDEGLEVLVKHRAALGQTFIVEEGNDDAIRTALDKEATYRLARELGIPVPRTWPVSDPAALERVLPELTFPAALKPRISHEFVKVFPSLKMFVASTPAELMGAMRTSERYGIPMMATELIPTGTQAFQSYYSYLGNDGTPRFHFTKRKLRQFPVLFGLGTYHVTDWDPDVAELGLRFFKGAGIRGIGNAEFIRDPRDNKLKLIECNARLTLTTEQLRISGLDLPLYVYNTLTGRTLPRMDRYRRNVYAIRPMSDVLSFLESKRRGETTFRQWFRSLLHIQHFLVFKLTDPWPALSRLVQFFARRFEIHSTLTPGSRFRTGTGFVTKGRAGI